jgi:3-oxo-5-alpha-steroid 4-dehydrogenase
MAKKKLRCAHSKKKNEKKNEKKKIALMNKLLVSLVGYGGALLIYVYIFWVHGASDADEVCALLCVCWSLHFFKRLIECLFVHKWRASSVDSVLMWLGEWVYYLGFATWIAYDNVVLRGGGAPATRNESLLLATVGAAMFCFGVLVNGYHHLVLASHDREKVPKIGLFELVSCPHYLGEVLTWIGFAAMSQFRIAPVVFALATCVVLAIYSNDRHHSYKRQFMNIYPEHRRRLIPFVW